MHLRLSIIGRIYVSASFTSKYLSNSNIRGVSAHTFAHERDIARPIAAQTDAGLRRTILQFSLKNRTAELLTGSTTVAGSW
jgi:hypothetical protein